jgi:hypothetical protein
MTDLKERLLSHIKINIETDCWEWQGSKRNGYGRMIVGSRKDQTRKSKSAHRVSYEIYHGEIPIGMDVCHKCDNPCCVNPNHLFVGTRQDNINDRESKGRNKIQYGSKNGRAKLNENQVLEIRKKRNSGMPFEKIAKEYGVCKKTIIRAVNGHNWATVVPEAPKMKGGAE